MTTAGSSRDPWVRRLTVAAVATGVLVIALYAAATVSLSGGTSELRTIADTTSR